MRFLGGRKPPIGYHDALIAPTAEVPVPTSLLITLLFAGSAHAQDAEDFELEDDFDMEVEPEEVDEAEASEDADEPDDLDEQDEQDDSLEEFRDPTTEPSALDMPMDEDEPPPVDLLADEEEEEEQQLSIGGDSEKTYRETAKRLGALGGDEELAGWDEYLETYPETVFRKRIETRTDALMTELYSSRINQDGEIVTDRAMSNEIDFSHPMQLENLNPRTRLQVGFEWGLPAYVNLILDYEHALARNFSLHAGIRRRYQGWNLEGGPRWALIKASRTDTIVSLLGDLHFNTNPTYMGFRPQLALGTRVGKFDLQAQGGPDLELRTLRNAATQQGELALQVRVVGGANIYFAASDQVGLFLETYLHMKPQPADGAFDGGLFAFNVATFGMKFYPTSKKNSTRDKEVNLGGTVPYQQEWWQFHFGSIMGQFNYYL